MPVALPPAARRLLFAAAAAFALVGLPMYLAPQWASANFAWSISPMVAMTMGGWYLGSIAMCILAAVHQRWAAVRAPALYLGLFGLSQAVVLALHVDRLRAGALLTAPYLAMLALPAAASLLAFSSWLRGRPAHGDEGQPTPRWVRVVLLIFAGGVLFLGIVGLAARRSGLYGEIFPEPLSPLTLQSFGAFYFSLAGSVIYITRAARLSPVTPHVQGGLVMIVLITLAAFANISAFDFALNPGQLIYVGVYLAGLPVTLFYLWRQRSSRLS